VLRKYLTSKSKPTAVTRRKALEYLQKMGQAQNVKIKQSFGKSQNPLVSFPVASP